MSIGKRFLLLLRRNTRHLFSASPSQAGRLSGVYGRLGDLGSINKKYAAGPDNEQNGWKDCIG